MFDGETIVWLMILSEWPLLLLFAVLWCAWWYGIGWLFKQVDEHRRG